MASFEVLPSSSHALFKHAFLNIYIMSRVGLSFYQATAVKRGRLDSGSILVQAHTHTMQ